MPCAFLRALHYGVGILLCSFGLLLTDTVWGAVTFSISPSGVSNLYSGAITLQVAGLTNGETVVLEKYLDAKHQPDHRFG